MFTSVYNSCGLYILKVLKGTPRGLEVLNSNMKDSIKIFYIGQSQILTMVHSQYVKGTMEGNRYDRKWPFRPLMSP